eukprot:scaffold84108_cov27-Tisochrysis_lutea.AAC.5
MPRLSARSPQRRHPPACAWPPGPPALPRAQSVRPLVAPSGCAPRPAHVPRQPAFAVSAHSPHPLYSAKSDAPPVHCRAQLSAQALPGARLAIAATQEPTWFSAT